MLILRPQRYWLLTRAGGILAVLVSLTLMASPVIQAQPGSQESATLFPKDIEFEFGTVDDGPEASSKGDTAKEEASDDSATYAAVVFGKGASDMMPTEYLIDSEAYGGGIYRRYIGMKREKGQDVRSGKIIQELLITPESLKDSPRLVVSRNPEGLQRLGIVSAKLWLKTVMQAGDDKELDDPDKVYGACVKKPFETDIPAKYLKPGEKIRKSWFWAQPSYENSEDREDCGLSLRLTTDETIDDELLLITAQLCRYPGMHLEFNSKVDDAECVDIGDTARPKSMVQVFLSEDNERLRAERSILLREEARTSGAKKEGGYLKGLMDTVVSAFKPVSSTDLHEELGQVSEIFTAFLEPMNAFSTAAYRTQLDPLYTTKASSTVYNETVVGVDDGTGEQFLEFLKMYPNGFKAALEKKRDTINLADSGIEKSVSEFKFTSGKLAGSVAFTFTLESNRGMSFTHVNGEKLELLDKAKMDKVTRLSSKHKQVIHRLDTCYSKLQAKTEDCSTLETEKSKLETDLADAQEQYRVLQEDLQELKDTQEERLRLKEGQVKLQADSEQSEIVRELEAGYKTQIDTLETLQKQKENDLALKHKQQMDNAEAKYFDRTRRLERELTVLQSQNKRYEEQLAGLVDLEEALREAKEERRQKIEKATEVLRNERDSLKAQSKRLAEQLAVEKDKVSKAEWQKEKEVHLHNTESRKAYYLLYDKMISQQLELEKWAENAYAFIERPWGSDLEKPGGMPFLHVIRPKEHANGTMYFVE